MICMKTQTEQPQVTQQHPVCEAVVVHCIDFRIQKYLNGHFDERFPNGYDVISLAGGVKHLLEDAEDKNIELEELFVSERLHHPKRIILIQHEDCGAYGGSKAFLDFKAEQAFQEEQLAKAEELLKKHFPKALVEKMLVSLSGKRISVV